MTRPVSPEGGELGEQGSQGGERGPTTTELILSSFRESNRIIQTIRSGNAGMFSGSRPDCVGKLSGRVTLVERPSGRVCGDGGPAWVAMGVWTPFAPQGRGGEAFLRGGGGPGEVLGSRTDSPPLFRGFFEASEGEG